MLGLVRYGRGSFGMILTGYAEVCLIHDRNSDASDALFLVGHPTSNNRSPTVLCDWFLDSMDIAWISFMHAR
jgi:hypothetical protein